MNPIFFRVVAQGRWPSLRTSFILAFALGLVSLAAGTAAVLLAGEAIYELMIWLAGLIALLMFITALVIAVVATILAADTKQDQMLALTTLNPYIRVRGCIAAALYRVRIPLILIIALLPLFVIGWSYVNIAVSIALMRIIITLGGPPDLPDFTPLSSVLRSLWLFSVLGLLIPFAAALGVRMGLQIQHRTIAAISSPIIFIILIVLFAVLGIGLAAFSIPYLLETVTILVVVWATVGLALSAPHGA
jgi:hypothetical protein